MKISIIGGGPAGLIAALYLSRIPEYQIQVTRDHPEYFSEGRNLLDSILWFVGTVVAELTRNRILAHQGTSHTKCVHVPFSGRLPSIPILRVSEYISALAEESFSLKTVQHSGRTDPVLHLNNSIPRIPVQFDVLLLHRDPPSA